MLTGFIAGAVTGAVLAVVLLATISALMDRKRRNQVPSRVVRRAQGQRGPAKGPRGTVR